MSILLLLIYLPLNIYWFYVNVAQLPIQPFSWNSVHNPARWNIIPYVPANDAFTVNRYVPASMSFFVFAFFGIGTEARRIYASIGTALGLGTCFPRLLRERRPSTDGIPSGERGWMNKLSLVSLGKRYFAKFNNRESEAATEMYVIPRLPLLFFTKSVIIINTTC